MPKKTPRDPSFVNIATLKANLATYLRRAEGGESITVFDRLRPIARLVSLANSEKEELKTVPASAKSSDISNLKLHSVETEMPDVVEFLIQDRRRR